MPRADPHGSLDFSFVPAWRANLSATVVIFTAAAHATVSTLARGGGVSPFAAFTAIFALAVLASGVPSILRTVMRIRIAGPSVEIVTCTGRRLIPASGIRRMRIYRLPFPGWGPVVDVNFQRRRVTILGRFGSDDPLAAASALRAAHPGIEVTGLTALLYFD